MSASFRRVTAAAVESPAATHRISRRGASSIGVLRINRRRGVGGGEGAVLRSTRWVIEAVVKKRGQQQPRCCSFDRNQPHHEVLDVAERGGGGVDRRVEVMVAVAATVVLGVGNRVLYKLALVPLKHYPFFLAQLATLGYVLVYFSILYFRYQAGKVTDEMLSLPKFPLIAVGLLEALAAASGMAAGAILSGAAIPILSQSFLVWQLFLSYIFLGRRYSFKQLFGCFLVAVGVIVTVASGSGTGSLMEAGLFWSVIMIVSFLLQAADTVLKETIFLDAAKRLKRSCFPGFGLQFKSNILQVHLIRRNIPSSVLKGGTVDLFVINSFGSAFQAVFICLLLPFLSNLWGIPFNQLPSYLKDGCACFLSVGSMSTRCNGAPLLPLLFIIVNMGFNISLLHLLKISSAVVSCLASTFSVPISVYLFTLPLPYLGVASSLPPGFVAGAIILAMGLVIYTWTPSLNSSSKPFSLVNPRTE